MKLGRKRSSLTAYLKEYFLIIFSFRLYNQNKKNCVIQKNISKVVFQISPIVSLT